MYVINSAPIMNRTTTTPPLSVRSEDIDLPLGDLCLSILGCPIGDESDDVHRWSILLPALFRNTATGLEGALLDETKRLLRACGLTADGYKNAFDVQGAFYDEFVRSSYELTAENAARLDVIARERGFAGGVNDYSDTFKKCFLFQMLTTPVQQMSTRTGKHDLSLRTFREERNAVLRSRRVGKELPDFPRLESGCRRFDLAAYFADLDPVLLFALGWGF